LFNLENCQSLFRLR